MPYSDTSLFPLGNLAQDLRGMSVPAMLRLALSFSDKSDDEIAAEMGWSEAQKKGFFSSRDYWPSLPNLPRLSRVVGNSIIARWILENSNFAGQNSRPMSAQALFTHLREILKEVSRLMEEGEKALEDNRISKQEARRILRPIENLLFTACSMFSGLQAVIDAEKEAK